MPNTIVHLGINYLAVGKVKKVIDPKWILVSAILPDIPWILRRIVNYIFNINIETQVYFTIHSSLLFCLILALALSFLSSQKSKTFLVLSIGSILHLLLDSLQIKWGNGSILFAPFDWSVISFGVVYPESIISIIITVICAIVIFIFRKEFVKSLDIVIPKGRNLAILCFLFLVYFFAPMFFFGNLIEQNVRGYETLLTREVRTGKVIEFDRVNFQIINNKKYIKSYSDELIELTNIPLNNSKIISLKGKFINTNLIKVNEYRVNNAMMRNLFSYIGLVFILYTYYYTFRRLSKES